MNWSIATKSLRVAECGIITVGDYDLRRMLTDEKKCGKINPYTSFDRKSVKNRTNPVIKNFIKIF